MALAPLVFSFCLLVPGEQSHRSVPLPRLPRIVVGWHNELNNKQGWNDLNMENKAKVKFEQGQMTLSLGQVPSDFPYSFQWSGVWRDVDVNLARFPIVMARVSDLKGYAHMDIDVLDAENKPIKTIRSSTLTEPGLSEADLSKSLDPAIYHLRIRLITGGPNSGCSATYTWIRFHKSSDTDFVRANPDFQSVIRAR